MELIVISDAGAVDNEGWLINNLFMHGLSIFHLRKPLYSIKQIELLLNSIDKQYHGQIALHQHHEMAGGFEIKRLHYTEQLREGLDLRNLQPLKDKGYTLSASIHNAALLPSLKSFAYVFYGPVFNSISKPGYQGNVPAGFDLAAYKNKPKVIALGGIEVSNLDKVKGMNFGGAAVLGTIWKEPEKAIDKFNQLKSIAATVSPHKDAK
jgi:thiamine-phosphate pyrophosphorylase